MSLIWILKHAETVELWWPCGATSHSPCRSARFRVQRC